MCRSPSETVPSADRIHVGPRFPLLRVSGSSLPNPGIRTASDSLGRHQYRAHPALSTVNIATGSRISGSFQPRPCLAARCESMFHRFHYRLFLSFESSVACSDVSNSAYPANENQVCLPLVVVDSLAGPALQLFPLSLPSALALQKIYPVFPSCWQRLVSSFFWRARLPCVNCDSSFAALRLRVPAKSF